MRLFLKLKRELKILEIIYLITKKERENFGKLVKILKTKKKKRKSLKRCFKKIKKSLSKSILMKVKDKVC